GIHQGRLRHADAGRSRLRAQSPLAAQHVERDAPQPLVEFVIASVAKQSRATRDTLDCFVAALLANDSLGIYSAAAFSGVACSIWAMARRSARSRSTRVTPTASSSPACAAFQIGKAALSVARPLPVMMRRRLRLSFRSTAILTRPRRSSGLRFAVSVVRSMASAAETSLMIGGSA